MIRVSIIGATGYTGGELLRYLVRHPEVTLTHVTTESYSGQPIHQIHKFLKGKSGLIGEKLNVGAVAKDSDLIFLCLPHGAAAKTASDFLKKGVKVIDLSADFRLNDLKLHEKWYGKHPAPSLQKQAVYGLPERYREEIRTATLVSNPGLLCYDGNSRRFAAGDESFAWERADHTRCKKRCVRRGPQSGIHLSLFGAG